MSTPPRVTDATATRCSVSPVKASCTANVDDRIVSPSTMMKNSP